jgi:esterase/lipase superfamily enzyme
MSRPESFKFSLRRVRCLLEATVLAVPLLACQTQLAHTPYVMLRENAAQIYDELPPEQRTPDMNIFYVTDREATEPTANGATYGSGRSSTLRFGEARVAVEPSMSWDELVKLSTTAERDRDYVLKVTATHEFGSIEPLTERMTAKDGHLVVEPEAGGFLLQQKQEMLDILAKRLSQSPRKDVYLLVHGFNNSFDDAVTRLAQVWHFMGRVGVPIAYTWPAGGGGARGYFYDRESGEFTIYHLKEVLRTIATCPGLERLHIISHSRGTDVATTALRELNLEYRSRGLDPQKELKLETFVLAAPDLDTMVFGQRFISEGLIDVARRVAIYYSSNDSALGLSVWLFSGKNRLGAMAFEDFKPRTRELLANLHGFQTIDCNVSGFASSHAYMFDDPAALSDLILLLRDRCDPGAENGRPLQSEVPGLWFLDNDYEKPKKP